MRRWLALLIALAAFGTLITLWICFVEVDTKAMTAFVLGHFPALVGLPMAAIAAFVLVTHLQQKSDEGVKIKMWKLELEGPSGQIILWVVCFLAIAGMIKLMW